MVTKGEPEGDRGDRREGTHSSSAIGNRARRAC